MVNVVICVGSSCYVRGSEAVGETFERLIRAGRLDVSVDVTGAFCMDRCSLGVSVRVGERVFSGLTPADAEQFFRREILSLAAAPVAATNAPLDPSDSEQRSHLQTVSGGLGAPRAEQ